MKYFQKTSKSITPLSLFTIFFKIGCFTFGGGWSILAQIEQEFIHKRTCITKEDLLEITAVGKSVPGIMITNISMILGYRLCGLLGGISAVLGISMPSVLILSVITVFYDNFKKNLWFHSALQGVQAAVVPIIAIAAFSLIENLFQSKKTVFIFMIAFLLCILTDLSNIVLIGIGIIFACIERGVCKTHDLS